MLIRIQEHGGVNLTIPLPTGLVCNAITAEIAAQAAKKQGVPMKAADLRRLFAAIRHYKRKHPDWVLVDVQSADGDRVSIRV